MRTKKNTMTKKRVQIKLNDFNPDKKEIGTMWTAMMDVKNHLDRKEQNFFLDSDCELVFTNRQMLAVLGEMFVLRVSVDALQEKVFPHDKEVVDYVPE